MLEHGRAIGNWFFARASNLALILHRLPVQVGLGPMGFLAAAEKSSKDGLEP